ncbi:MAG: hypothetical protein HON65_06455 [Rhodospirillales bacterium]|jgi:hypothetical protein|nr:hypothetical protein [Rhodospirillales bacterium]
MLTTLKTASLLSLTALAMASVVALSTPAFAEGAVDRNQTFTSPSQTTEASSVQLSEAAVMPSTSSALKFDWSNRDHK